MIQDSHKLKICKDFIKEVEANINRHDGSVTMNLIDRNQKLFSDTPLSLAAEQCITYRDALHYLRHLISESTF